MQNDRLSDEQIVKKVIQGEIEKFELIVNKYQAYIFSIGMRFFKNEDDASDFVQDVFIKAYNELKSYKGNATFCAWLIKVAYNYGINQEKARRIENITIEEFESNEPSPENRHLKNERIKALRMAIDSLPDKYRICIDLYFFLGFKYIDIKDITGFPINTIKSNVLRAKGILRNKLRGSIAEDYHEM